MIPSHLRDRFFQRYGIELSGAMLREIAMRAVISTVREPDAFIVGRERVWIDLEGKTIGLAWSTKNRYVVTFLPEHARIGQKPPKSGGRVRIIKNR